MWPWLILACDAPPPDALGVGEVELGETVEGPSAATLRFTTTDVAAAWVEVELADGLSWRFEAHTTDGEAHVAYLAGLPPGATLQVRAVAEGEGGRAESAWMDWATREASSRIPPAVATVPMTDSLLYLAVLPFNPPAAVVFDGGGALVWWALFPDGSALSQAVLSRDGMAVWVLVNSPVAGEGDAELWRVPIFEGEAEVVQIQGAHHDFVELEDGSFLALVSDIREVEGESVAGDELQRVATDGTTTRLWDTWDELEYDGEGEQVEGDDGDLLISWTHANSLAWDAAHGRYLVGLRNRDAVAVVDGDDWTTRGWVGGEDSTYTMGAGTPFHRQHGVVATDAGVLLFDNGAQGEEDPSSRVVEFALDDAAGTYAEVWSWAGAEPLYSPYLGGVARLADGGHVVSWGGAGRMTRSDADGALVGQLDLTIGGAFGAVHPLERLGP